MSAQSQTGVLNYPFYGSGNTVAESRGKNLKIIFWARHGHYNHGLTVVVDTWTVSAQEMSPPQSGMDGGKPPSGPTSHCLTMFPLMTPPDSCG